MASFFRRLLSVISKRRFVTEFYFNHLCSRVRKNKKGKIIIYKGARLFIDKSSYLSLNSDYIIIYPNSRVEISSNSVLEINDRLYIGKQNITDGYSGTTVNIFDKSSFSSGGGYIFSGASVIVYGGGKLVMNGYVDINYGCLVRCNYNMVFGKNILIGRGTFITDTDTHHIILNGEAKNNKDQTILGNNVWIGANCVILKGTKIANSVVVGAATTIAGKVVSSNNIIRKSQPLVINGIEKWEG